MAFPKVAIVNHSIKFLANLQRRLKTEALDVSVYHQNLETVSEIEQLNPDLIVLGRNFGYLRNDQEFIQRLRQRPPLVSTPIIVFLIETMLPPPFLPADVTAVWIAPSYVDLEPLVAMMYQRLKSFGNQPNMPEVYLGQ